MLVGLSLRSYAIIVLEDLLLVSQFVFIKAFEQGAILCKSGPTACSAGLGACGAELVLTGLKYLKFLALRRSVLHHVVTVDF